MSNEKTGRRGKKRIWGKDDTELSLLALPTTIWYLLFCFLPYTFANQLMKLLTSAE